MEVILFALGLGLAGIDPLGLLLAMSARASGASRRQIVLLSIITLVGTVGVGTAIVWLLGDGVQAVASWFAGLPDTVWLWLEVIIILLLLIWAAKRVIVHLRPPRTEASASQLNRFIRYGMTAVSVVFMLSMFADPTVLGLLTVAARHGQLLYAALGLAIWITLSQLPLFVFTIMMLCGADKAYIRWFTRFRSRYRRRISLAITAALGLIILVLLLDVGVFVLSGQWVM